MNITTLIFSGLVLFSNDNGTLIADSNNLYISNEVYQIDLQYQAHITKDTKYLFTLYADINLQTAAGEEVAYYEDILLIEEAAFNEEDILMSGEENTLVFDYNVYVDSNYINFIFNIAEENDISNEFIIAKDIRLPFTGTGTLPNGEVDSYFQVYTNDLLSIISCYDTMNKTRVESYNNGQNNVIQNPNGYGLYTESQYNAFGNLKYQEGYTAGKTDENPTGLEWFKSAVSLTQSFLDIEILPGGITLGSVLSGFVILVLLKWILAWFRS